MASHVATVWNAHVIICWMCATPSVYLDEWPWWQRSFERRHQDCRLKETNGWVDYAQLCTHYGIPICSKLYQLCLQLCPKFAYIMLELCPCIISGKSKLVCSNNYFTLYRKVNWNRMGVQPLKCNIMEVQCSPPDSVIDSHCSLTSLQDTSWSWTGTWSEYETVT